MQQVPDKVDFTYDVKPILSDRCFACHGPDKAKQKAGLRLDTPDALEKLCEGGRKALVAGDLTRSEVFHRILATDPDVVMPTPDSHLSLSAQEKAVLIKWIQQGAEYKPHWSLAKIDKPNPPTVENESWVVNEIDQFVLKKLEDKGLQPSQQAPKETLLRRVSLDLTGLPPTLAERAAFLADSSANAYEKVVNRLLHSPHYGERMATSWLDVARYADTRGYQIDFPQAVYPYRDWVIRAYNRNLSFDRFIQWQLAGDLLLKATPEQRMATCFLRLHPQNEEDGIIDEEYRTEYVVDRVNTFGKAMLGFSVECARCHDHKYDPISQKDFYQLYAFFNTNNEAGLIPHLGEAAPSMPLMNARSADTLRQIRQFISRLQPPPTPAAFAKWASRPMLMADLTAGLQKGLISHVAFDDTNTAQPEQSLRAAFRFKSRDGNPFAFMPGKIKNAFRLDGGMGIEFDDKLNIDRNQPFSFSLWVNLLDAGAKGPLVGKSNGRLNGRRGYFIELNEDKTLSITFAHIYPDDAIELRTRQKLPLHAWQHLALTYDGSSKAAGIGLYVNGQKVPINVINDNLHKSILYVLGRKNYPLGAANFRIGFEKDRSVVGVAVDEFRAYNRTIADLDIQQLAGQSAQVIALAKTSASQRTPLQNQQLTDWYRLTFDQAYEAYARQLSDQRGRENTLLTNQPEIMVYHEARVPRATFLLSRGAYDAPKERVFPDVPARLHPMPANLPKNRLGLANWLLSRDHPLFARVMVNRLWQQVFGKGIVKTSDDFGNQGVLPTHPELLDWLAVRFRDGDEVTGPRATDRRATDRWNVKAMMKLIVMSATYRQSSVPTKEQLDKDPDNQFYSRAPTYRLGAEIVRDNALATSGLLNPQVGGPSVKPYQPAGLWEALARGSANDEMYVQDKGAKLYRRSMYTYWKRNAPPPAMMNFDTPDRFICIINRQKTSTPLQSLVTLNDPQFIEAARVLAQHLLAKKLPPLQLIDRAFESVISRRARPDEVALLQQMYRDEIRVFKKDLKQANALLTVGEYPIDTTLPPIELAAWTTVMSTLMNFDEAIVKR
jgi:hypothetical protein